MTKKPLTVSKALVVVDMQNDFMPGGPMGVRGADAVVPIINALMTKFALVIATQDWHLPDHVSFAVNHVGKKPGDLITVNGIEQILWATHCVCNTEGAELVAALHKEKIDANFYKGTDRWIDSYSAFFDNARRKSTGLEEYLKAHAIRDVVLAGLTTDYCVLYSALDALDLGFQVTVVADACRPINLKPDDERAAYAAMRDKGANISLSSALYRT